MQKKVQMQSAYLNLYGAIGNSIIQIATKQGKTQFILQKAFQVGMAVMSAFVAANNALATVPYPANLAASAQVLKLGLINAGAVAAQAIGQMATSGGGGGGGAIPTYNASPYTGLPTYDQEEKKGGLVIHFHGDMLADPLYIEMLAEKISEAVETKDIHFVASNAKYAEAVI